MEAQLWEFTTGVQQVFDRLSATVTTIAQPARTTMELGIKNYCTMTVTWQVLDKEFDCPEDVRMDILRSLINFEVSTRDKIPRDPPDFQLC